MLDVKERILGKIPSPDTGIEIRKSICTICDPQTQCGLDLYVRDGKIIKVEGSKENPHSAGTLCAKGAATRQYVYHKDRIKTPLKRIGPRGSGKFEPISWDEALDTIAANLNKAKDGFGPESVAFYAGYTKWMRPFFHRLAHSFGSPNYLTESSSCAYATIMAWRLVFGVPGNPDIKNAGCLFVWASNPFQSMTCISRHIMDAKERGLKLIVVDPRCTPTAAWADIHLKLKPGTDGALALTMANVIINEDLYDRDFVGSHSVGFDAYREYVEGFTPRKGEELTGVPAETIQEAARLYAMSKPAALFPSFSAGVHQTNGIQNTRAVLSLVGLTGNYDIPGGNVVVPFSFVYMAGGFSTREAEFTHPKAFEEMAPRIGQDKFPVWCDLVDEAQSIYMPFQIQSEKPYPVKSMLAFGINHRMWPDSDFMAENLKKLDFIANVDLFMTDSCKFADIVLPACSSVERSELRCYPQQYVIYTRPAIEPLYESRSDADIIYDLAERLKMEDPLFSAGYEASLDWILEPSGITIEELKKHPAGMPVPNPVAVPERKYLKNGFPTPSGKMEFKSKLLEKYTESHGYDPLPAYNPPKYSQEATPELAAEYPFILNTGSRLPMFVHSRTFRLSWTRCLRPEPAADINPSNGERLEIKQGDVIRLTTPKGSIVVKANLTQIVRPGVVHMLHDYPEASVNNPLDGDYVDPISSFPGFKVAMCRVEKMVGEECSEESKKSVTV